MAPQSSKSEPPTPIHERKEPSSLPNDDSSAYPAAVENFSKLYFWGERYNEKLERYFGNRFGSFLAFLAVFVLGINTRGEWALIAVYFAKYFQTGASDTYVQESEELIESISDWCAVRFKGYFSILIPTVIVTYVTYFGTGGFLHWFYYVRQRDRPETWKCQPENWLSPEIERHEIMVGSIALAFGSNLSAGLSCYVLNGGWTTIYYDAAQYGYLYLIVQVPLCYIWQDYSFYWLHRLYHTPWLYKKFHKLHHTYKQPTAFAVVALHPIELLSFELMMMSPMFIFPVYWLVFCISIVYIYYHGTIDHSGINFKRHWWQPWQPDSIFHDNHHHYSYVNFGINCELWDKLHGTCGKKDGIYREDIFYGHGKSFDEASADEVKQDLEERLSENPKAWPGVVGDFDLNEDEIKEKLN